MYVYPATKDASGNYSLGSNGGWSQTFSFKITGTTADGSVVDVPFDGNVSEASEGIATASGILASNTLSLAKKVAEAGKDVVNTFTVTLDNKNGDVLSADVTLSNVASKVVSAAFKANVTKEITSTSAIKAQIGSLINVKDQYGKEKSVEDTDITKIKVTDLDATTKIEKNNTLDVVITDVAAAGDDVTVEITFKSGVVSTFKFLAK